VELKTKNVVCMQPPKKKPNRMKQQNSLKHKLITNEEKTLGQVTKKKK
jgi:hypothetical protein